MKGNARDLRQGKDVAEEMKSQGKGGTIYNQANCFGGMKEVPVEGGMKRWERGNQVKDEMK